MQLCLQALFLLQLSSWDGAAAYAGMGQHDLCGRPLSGFPIGLLPYQVWPSSPVRLTWWGTAYEMLLTRDEECRLIKHALRPVNCTGLFVPPRTTPFLLHSMEP